MTAMQPGDQAWQRNLGDGLVLRWSTPDDIERICALYSIVFRQNADAPPTDGGASPCG